MVKRVVLFAIVLGTAACGREQPEVDVVEPVEDRLEAKSETAREHGDLLAKEAEKDKAIAFLTDAIYNDPRNAKAYRDRGKIYLEQGERELALEDLNDAIRLDPLDPLALRLRARVYEAMNEDEKARLDREAAEEVAKAPKNGEEPAKETP